MLDAKDRENLAARLRGKIKKANSNVSTKVEAENGDFKVVIASDSLTHVYQGETVSTIRVAELDDELIGYINSDPQDAAQEILDEFVKSYDPSKAASNKKSTKTAAHDSQNDETWQKITQKQLDDQTLKLHPRQDEYYTNITQKQLPEHGQRPGTYDIITEGQFRDERKTFYNAPRTSGDWRQEDRNVVTEGQFEEGVDTYTEVGGSDRGETGSKYDGGLEKQWRQIGEKQLMELLKHHEWTEPLTTTEGKDQLGQQDGELSRLTADVAGRIIKEALDALGKTVLSVGIPPQQLSSIIHRLVSHSSKYPALANTIQLYKGAGIEAIENKVAKARAFGKTANTGRDWSDIVAADVFVRQLAKLAYNPQFVVEALVALAGRQDFADRINKSADDILSAPNEKKVAESSIFSEVLNGKTADVNDTGSADEDGLYAFEGQIVDVKADVNNQKDFAEKAATFGKEQILSKVANKHIVLVPQMIDVDEEKGIFQVQYKDANFGGNKLLSARAEKRRKFAETKKTKIAKTASVKKAQMGGAGGMPPAAGSDMGNPMAPPGGGDAGMAPPGEALSQEPPVEEEGAGGGGGEPMPPGAVCPVCGGQNVDVDNGEFRCNNCGGEGSIHVKLDVTKWPETIQETGDEKGGFGLEEGMGAEESGMEESGGLAGEGEGTTLPNVPVGASVRITPFMIEKLSSQKIQLGSVCPNCGGHNTDLSKSANSKGHDGICYDCYQEFKFQVKANLDKKNNVFAQYVWLPKIAETGCAGCKRASILKQAFVQSLRNYGMTWNQFDSLPSMKDQADTILKMAKAGSLNIKEAMEQPLQIEKTAQRKFDKFPSASCIERIARRMGENATAMSGPCQGKPLAQCVCSQLEGLGVYTDGLASKVAMAIQDRDPLINSPMQSCLSTFVRVGYQVKEACTICDAMRAAYAMPEDLVIESIAQFDPAMAPKSMAAPSNVKNPATKPMTHKPMSPKPMAAPGSPAGAPAPNTPPNPMDTPAPVTKPMGAPGASPMEMPSPMDEPITDDLGGSDLGGDEFGGGVGGDEFGGDGFSMEIDTGFDDGMDIGLEGNTVTIELPAEAAQALQTLMDALQGNIGEGMIDTTGDDLDDVSEITEDTVDVGDVGDSDSDDSLDADDDTNGNTPFGDNDGDDEGGDTDGGLPFGDDEGGDEEEDKSGIPGLDDDADDTEMIKESEPEDSSEAKDMKMKSSEPKKMKLVEVANTSEGVTKEASAQELDNLLFSMKRGAIKRQGTALDDLFDGFLRQASIRQAKIAAKQEDGVKKQEYKGASEGSKIKNTPAQDSTEVKYKDGGKIGHEEAFKADKPDIPRSQATIGDESKENTVSETGDAPKVPHGSPAMAGEKHYRPEKGNVVDGNQGAQTTAQSGKGKAMKTAKTWTVAQNHKYYGAFMKKAAGGQSEVKLTDGVTYVMSMDQNKNIVLVAKDCNMPMKKKDMKKKDMGAKGCNKAQNSAEIKKESQTVAPKSVDKLEDDPDINQSSGPGKGKTHADKAHSLGVDEKKPSEGMNEPSVPKAPNDGRLSREHTVDRPKDGPEIPAGGGMNSDYDQNEKNKPEKQDQLLGKQNDIAAMASVSRDEAVKIAGQMLKAQMITIDELPGKINELSKATPEILRDYENLIRTAGETKGMRKAASSNSVEASLPVKTAGKDEPRSELKDNVQNLFTLEGRNKDYERYTEKSGNPRLYR